jgi:hypothetical protein
MDSMKTVIFMFVALAAAMASTMVPAVYAAPPANPNGFGEAASQFLGDDRQMGGHASSLDGSPGEPGRLGLGNVLNQGDPKDSDASKHPSDLAAALCPPGSSNSACTSERDPGNNE